MLVLTARWPCLGSERSESKLDHTKHLELALNGRESDATRQQNGGCFGHWRGFTVSLEDGQLFPPACCARLLYHTGGSSFAGLPNFETPQYGSSQRKEETIVCIQVYRKINNWVWGTGWN